MSNYFIDPINKDHAIMIGWDPPLNTYFAHVLDKTKNEDHPGREILWIGCYPNEIHDVDTIRRAVAPYAKVPEIILTKIYGEANE